MPEIQDFNKSERLVRLFFRAQDCCLNYRHEFITPEHLLYVLLDEQTFYEALCQFADYERLHQELKKKLDEMESVPDNVDYDCCFSELLGQVVERALQQVALSSAGELDITHVVKALMDLDDCWASYLLKRELKGADASFLSELITSYEWEDIEDTSDQHAQQAAWRKLVTCMNVLVERRNPLIGREAELQRTIQVLCRRDKNNPLHVGEPGVGKTALVWGLVRRINEGRVPQRLKGSRVYMLDLATMLAGTQYRGDLEDRIKQVMDGVAKESDNNIIYIDEIHNLVGAGAVGESSMDASNMLKPYLEAGTIRFIGSTTYEEFNKFFSRSKGMVRRFQQIDIPEPSVDETRHILCQLQPLYEAFHHCTYDDEAIGYAVEASAKYVNDRFLPDKAIDLIDEAGAAKESELSSLVTKADIADVLAKTCKVDSMAMSNDDDDNERLATLGARLSVAIYGQDEAIRQVVEAVQMSKAGLLDEGKPLASLLFVGPTGVGKTEVARVLARQLGIELLRFDMSEYTEKHTVAKLIGSPAGYVGYEDGGLLTDAIRKTPHCVLLLDELEKAHQDIYNILLQVMDYARLTDNKGRKADFRNVIIIMTSNAGAQYASQASIGFSGGVSRGEAMLRQVKKTFKPEFINRLSGTVVFNDMDETMARLILRKKLGELQEKLTARHVEMTVADDAFALLLKEGFTREYGAREMDRVINGKLKPVLMREMLFGSLKQGGSVVVGLLDNGTIGLLPQQQ